jgi:V/A-type H+-transporting ATPase subunit D
VSGKLLTLHKLKRLGREVVRVTRRIRVLEERILPGLQQQVKTISRFLGEREREATFRLKRFREGKGCDKNRLFP